MTLTPEDVVNKRFQATKFREGYDQDEVDDFLDEVVVELRRLTQENEELRQRVGVPGDMQQAAAAAFSVDPAEVAQLNQEIAELKQRLAEATRAQQNAPVPQPQSSGDDPNETNNLLQLARRLHEEHVREGSQKRDALIAEGHATANRLIAEAENTQRAQISSLEQERFALERRVNELRGFERDYRQKLKTYIESQLRELDGASLDASAPPVRAPEPGGVPAPVAAAVNDGSLHNQPSVFPNFG